MSQETATGFIKRYEAEKQELTAKVKEISEKIERQKQTANGVDTFIRLMKQYVDIAELDRAAAVELIEKIIISEKETLNLGKLLFGITLSEIANLPPYSKAVPNRKLRRC